MIKQQKDKSIKKEVIKWDDSDSKLISRNLEEMMGVIILKNGQLGFPNFFKVTAYVYILAYKLQFTGIDSIETKRNIVQKAAFKLRKSESQDLLNFKGILSRIVLEYLERPEKTYNIILPLNIDSHSLKNRRWFNVLGIRFKISTWDYVENHFQLKKWLYLDGYGENWIPYFTPLISTIKGRDYEEAFRLANDAFDLLRLFFNLGDTFGKIFIQSGHPQHLIKILPPPTYGIFDDKGSFIENYYHTDIPQSYKRVDLAPDRLKYAIRLLSRYLKPSKGSEDTNNLIQNAFRKYGKAMDTTDWRDTFLNLWQILELITYRSTKRFNMKDVCKRVSTLLNNQPFFLDLLGALYETRNKLVHRGAFPAEEGLWDVNILKYIVECCIIQLSPT